MGSKDCKWSSLGAQGIESPLSNKNLRTFQADGVRFKDYNTHGTLFFLVSSFCLLCLGAISRTTYLAFTVFHPLFPPVLPLFLCALFVTLNSMILDEGRTMIARVREVAWFRPIMPVGEWARHASHKNFPQSIQTSWSLTAASVRRRASKWGGMILGTKIDLWPTGVG